LDVSDALLKEGNKRKGRAKGKGDVSSAFVIVERVESKGNKPPSKHHCIGSKGK
jgi:hypothetical protein